MNDGGTNLMEIMEQEFTVPATVESLRDITDCLAELLASAEVPVAEKLQMEIAVEEIFVNIACYAYKDQKGTVVVRARLEGDPLCVEFVFLDTGEAYNPLTQGEPDITLSLEDRAIGGLGIFLARKNVDDVGYERRDGKNILTLRKYLCKA